ncbi:MAG: DciA family protein [Pseudomonadota bacterium]|nr:DciA family protein [Pseudomonadota bacterium]
MPKSIQHASRFLKQNDAVAVILRGIERNAKLLRAIRRVLPPPLDDHCLHATLEERKLTLVTGSSVWASRLRFFGPELQRALADAYGSIATCRVRIQPQADPNPATEAAQPAHRLSEGTVKHLLEAAGGMEDGEIAAALRRLAKAGGDGD